MQPLSDLQAETHRAADPAPPDAAERKESSSQLVRAMERLPGNQQEVLRLKFQQHLTYKEIARVTDLTVNHVGVLIHNGLKTLRIQLADVQVKA